MEKQNTNLRNQVISEVDLLELLNVEQPTLDRLRLEKGLSYIRLSRNARVYLVDEVVGWLRRQVKAG